jgi:multidrug transporter EmrE-like cation transporter
VKSSVGRVASPNSLRLHYVFLWSGIVIGVGGQWMLKAGAAAPDLLSQLLSASTIAGLVLYGAATVCYLIAIRRIPITVAFPSISVSYIVILAMGVIVFGESLSLAKLAGTGLIMAGVWLLNR